MGTALHAAAHAALAVELLFSILVFDVVVGNLRLARAFHLHLVVAQGDPDAELHLADVHADPRDDAVAVTATTVRVPVWGGHSESVNVEFERPFEVDEARALMASMPGVVVQDDPANQVYPMPRFAEGKDEVFVGRIRRDFSVANGLNFWCVSDNLRKGAATNAVQIACLLLEKGLLPA